MLLCSYNFHCNVDRSIFTPSRIIVLIRKMFDILDEVIGWIFWILVLTPIAAIGFTLSFLNKLRRNQR